MAGDYSRFTHDPRKRFSELLLQQGRVQLDADWNEQMKIVSRRFQTQALDTFGPRAVSRFSTPDAFEVSLLPGPPPDLGLGVGRVYIDGLVAEIFPGESISYSTQPFLPSPPALGGFAGQDILVYLDLWEREVTSIEDPSLLEKALGGPDTTTRTQLVWQVKLLGSSEVEGPVSCALDLEAQFPPSSGRLSSRAVQPPAGTDPCVLPESGGFRGLENRLYRVEIHQGGSVAQARFKWSRENASVVSAVEAIATAGATTLTVTRIGRDPILRFAIDDWVEVIDDRLELLGQAGHMARIVDLQEETRTLLLDRALPAGVFDPTNPARHTRVRRWDQREDVDANGLLSIGAGWIPLEDGIEVQLGVDPLGGTFRAGDTWVFAARVADASVEELTAAPPRAIIHHYAPLATISTVASGNAINDCRTLWPPLAEGGASCECTVCVTQQSHSDGSLTLDAAIAMVRERGGGKICIERGTFLLEKPLEITDARALEMSGVGQSTILVYAGGGPAIRITESTDVRLHDFALLSMREQGNIGISIDDSYFVGVERVAIGGIGPSIGVQLAGIVLAVQIRDCWINTAVGISAAITGERSYFYGLEVDIEGNELGCSTCGVSLWSEAKDEGFLFLDEVDIRDNLITSGTLAGVRASGLVLPGSVLRIEENEIRTVGPGIVFGTNDTVIADNDISGTATEPVSGRSHTGIIFLRTQVAERIEIRGNDISNLLGDGIAFLGNARLVLVFDNTLTNIGISGIFVGDDAREDKMVIRGNVLREIGSRESERAHHAGILVVSSDDVSISDNHLDRITRVGQGGSISGIRVDSALAIRIADNTVLAVGVNGQRQAYGIEVRSPLAELTISGNHVTGQPTDIGSVTPALWAPLSIGRELAGLAVNVRAVALATVIRENRAFVLGTTFIRALLNRRVRVGIHANFLDAERSFVPAAYVDLTGSGILGDCVFSENRCELVASSDSTAAATAFIRSLNVVASNNLIRGNVRTALQLQCERFTVLGNLTDGGISVNGGPLGPPWAQLNEGT